MKNSPPVSRHGLSVCEVRKCSVVPRYVADVSCWTGLACSIATVDTASAGAGFLRAGRLAVARALAGLGGAALLAGLGGAALVAGLTRAFFLRAALMTELFNLLAAASISAFARFTIFFASLNCRRACLAACLARFADFLAACQRSRASSTAPCSLLRDLRTGRFARVFTMFSPHQSSSIEDNGSQQLPPEQERACDPTGRHIRCPRFAVAVWLRNNGMGCNCCLRRVS
jgi:hypothetical protein